MKKKYFLLLLFGMASIFCHAQKNDQIKSPRYRIMKVIPGTNTPQMVNMRYEGTKDVTRLQESVTFIDANNSEHTYTPDSLKAFFLDDKSYYSFSFTYRGKNKKAFLQKCMDDTEHGINMFAYYEGSNMVTFYVQKNNEDKLYPANDNPQTGYISPLHEKLREIAGSKASSIEKDIDGTRMTPDRYKALLNKITGKRTTEPLIFRWGVTAAAELSSINVEGYDLKSSVIASVGAFADIPLIANLSFHPELLLTKYGVNGTVDNQKFSTVAYNATTASIPLMLRYTIKSGGKTSPYVQLGYQPNFALSNELKYAYLINDVPSNNVNDNNKYTRTEEGKEDISSISSNAVLGLGLEYAMSKKHSLFIDLRAKVSPSETASSGFMLSVSYNL